MSEIIVTFCDFCNGHQSTNNLGRGVAEVSEEEAIQFFDWYRTKDDKIMCTQCRDEKDI